jgi:acyl dehydratase
MDLHRQGTVSIGALAGRVGEEVGLSPWRLIDQAAVDRFAEVTDDHQFIHVDPARAAETSFGGTIAHGFLTLSLLSAFAREALPAVEGGAMAINYGFDRVRFLSPVRVGARIRARFVLVDVSMRSAAEASLRYGVVVEVEGAPKPALTAEWIVLAALG